MIIWVVKNNIWIENKTQLSTALRMSAVKDLFWWQKYLIVTILLTTSQTVTKPAFYSFNSCFSPQNNTRFEFGIKKKFCTYTGSGHGFRYLCLLVNSTRYDSLAFSAFQKTLMLTWTYSTIHKLISEIKKTHTKKCNKALSLCNSLIYFLLFHDFLKSVSWISNYEYDRDSK